MDKSKIELVKSILTSIEKHPNAKVSKLIKSFELDKNPQNLALLLIELAEHPEFASDTTISLKYYLDCFERLHQEPSFAESGIILYNSSRIYAKRVDHVHQEIERLILSLSNVEDAKDSNPDANSAQNPVKQKRGRKRPLEQINGPYEANISAKRFKPLSETKRFDVNTTRKRNNALKRNPLNDIDNSTKTYIPQATWQYSVIQNFDYEDEVDSKKNYKLCTFHLEHRYNTLIPDINFKMYFKMKDFIDEASNDSELPESWPPLSDAYIEQYLHLEDAIMLREGHLGKAHEKTDVSKLKKLADSLLKRQSNNTEHCVAANITQDSGIELDRTENTSNTQLIQSETVNISVRNVSPDSGIELDRTGNTSNTQLIQSETVNISVQNVSPDSGIELDRTGNTSNTPQHVQSQTGNISLRNVSSDSGIDLNTSSPADTTIENIQLPVREAEPPQKSTNKNAEKQKLIKVTSPEKDPTLLTNSNDEDLSTLKLILPHISDEAIFMSDLDEKHRKMLSPSVITQDVFRCIKDKSNIVIKVDDTIEQLYKITLPIFERPELALRLNILKIPLKHFNKRRRFKLGPEYDLRKKERLKKYVRRSAVIKVKALPRKWVRIGEEVIGGHVSPPSTPSYEPDWLGFPEELTPSRSLSRDSGISLHQTDDFSETPDLLSSTMKTSESMDNITSQEKDFAIIERDIQLTRELSTSGTAVDESSQITTKELSTSGTAVDESSQITKELSTSDTTVDVSSEITDVHLTKELSTADSVVEESSQITDKISNKIDEMNEEARIRKKVHEWHSHLQPILACSRERHHFDVFALGTEIMTQFDRSDVTSEKVSFKNVMEEKEESLISRYFLSMLLLANQGNILIDVQNKSTSKPSELHDIRLKLLSRKRNIVSLEDNIGLQTPPATATTSTAVSTLAIVRTLKSVPEVPKMDDLDSGVAMSEECIA